MKNNKSLNKKLNKIKSYDSTGLSYGKTTTYGNKNDDNDKKAVMKCKNCEDIIEEKDNNVITCKCGRLFTKNGSFYYKSENNKVEKIYTKE